MSDFPVPLRLLLQRTRTNEIALAFLSISLRMADSDERYIKVDVLNQMGVENYEICLEFGSCCGGPDNADLVAGGSFSTI